MRACNRSAHAAQRRLCQISEGHAKVCKRCRSYGAWVILRSCDLLCAAFPSFPLDLGAVQEILVLDIRELQDALQGALRDLFLTYGHNGHVRPDICSLSFQCLVVLAPPASGFEAATDKGVDDLIAREQTPAARAHAACSFITVGRIVLSAGNLALRTSSSAGS